MKGRLLLGITYKDQLYFDFKVKLLSVAGECRALEIVDGLHLNEDESKRSRSEIMLNELAFLTQQLEVDGIPQDVITAEFLLENLAPDDYLLIWSLIDKLRKKHINAGENLKE